MNPHRSANPCVVFALSLIGLATPAICFCEDDKPAFKGKIYFESYLTDSDAKEMGIADQDLAALRGFFALDPNDWSWKQCFPFDTNQRGLSLAPDGRTLAAGRSLPSRKVEFWLMDLDGEKPRRNLPGEGGLVIWAPDSKSLICRRPVGNGAPFYVSEAWLYRLDGSEPTKLQLPDNETVIDWQADRLLTWRRNEPMVPTVPLISYKTDLSDRVILVPDANVGVDPARLSPDGKRLGFTRRIEAAPYLEPWVKDLATKAEYRIDLKDPELSVVSVAWSPDGVWLGLEVVKFRKDAINGLLSGPGKIVIASADGKTVIVPPIPFRRMSKIDWR